MSNYLKIIFQCDLILQNKFLYFRRRGGPFWEVWKKILEEKTPPLSGGRGGPFLGKLNPKSDTNTKKRDIKEESKKTEETAEEKQQRLKKEKELKIALAKQRYQERKETHS